MGLNDEYSRDAYQGDHYVYDSDDPDEFDNELDPADWLDMYSQEILDGWMYLRQYFDENYIQCKAQFPDFCDLVLAPSKWYTNQTPGTVQERLWTEVSSVPLIAERVRSENFYAWIENYVDYL